MQPPTARSKEERQFTWCDIAATRAHILQCGLLDRTLGSWAASTSVYGFRAQTKY